jgi:hypothetical protein
LSYTIVKLIDYLELKKLYMQIDHP